MNDDCGSATAGRLAPYSQSSAEDLAEFPEIFSWKYSYSLYNSGFVLNFIMLSYSFFLD